MLFWKSRWFASGFFFAWMLAIKPLHRDPVFTTA